MRCGSTAKPGKVGDCRVTNRQAPISTRLGAEIGVMICLVERLWLDIGFSSSYECCRSHLPVCYQARFFSSLDRFASARRANQRLILGSIHLPITVAF